METIKQKQKRIIELPIVKIEEKQSLKRDELINAYFAQISAQSENSYEQDERVDYNKKQACKHFRQMFAQQKLWKLKKANLLSVKDM